jgi:hypothetical protein
MFSNAKIKDHPKTVELKLNGLTGIVFGQTIPSMSGVDDIIVGDSTADSAINVYFDDLKKGYWFSEDLVLFVDHNVGAVASVGQTKMEKQSDGSWKNISQADKSTSNFLQRFLTIFKNNKRDK